MAKAYFEYQYSFSSMFSKWPLYYHLTLRGRCLDVGAMHSFETDVKSSKTEMTASVQGIKSKHTRGQNVFCLVLIKQRSF